MKCVSCERGQSVGRGSPAGSKAERVLEARREVARLSAALLVVSASAVLATKKFVDDAGRELVVSLDAEGFLVVSGSHHTHSEARQVCAMAMECPDFGPVVLGLRESALALRRAREAVLS